MEQGEAMRRLSKLSFVFMFSSKGKLAVRELRLRPAECGCLSSLWQAGGQGCPRSVLVAEVFDGVLEDADALIELIYGNELAGAMGHADVAGAEDDGFGAEID